MLLDADQLQEEIMKRIMRQFTGVFFCILIFSGLSSASDYPNKAITVISPYAAGGSMDLQLRGLFPYLSKELKVDLVIQNVTGASGVLGYNRAFKATPDGYTLVGSNIPGVIITEIGQSGSAYRTRDFIPICAFARDSVVLITHPELYKDFGEFVKAAKAQAVRLGVTGKGTTVHLAGLVLENALGVKFNFIPFEGGSESVTALAGKHIDAVLTIASSANSMVRAGRIKPLIIFANERTSKYPQVAVAKEFGYEIHPFSNHTGVLAPPKTPPDRLKVLEAAFDRAVRNPGYLEWMEKGVAEYVPILGKEYENDITRMIRIIDGYREMLK
jgi:tripartite-type tricarboxylate transporter receptor subunit TctC